MSKKPRFSTPCESQHVKKSEILHHALPLYCFTTSAKTELEKVRLTASKILRVLVNTLTADVKYCLHNEKDLREPIQLQLSTKNKLFSKCFAAYLKSTPIFESFEKS